MADTRIFRLGRSDENIVDRAYRQHWAELCRYVRKAFGAGPPEPEEVAQGAFARFAALEDPREVGNPRAFLYRCARNIVLDHKRRKTVHRRAEADPLVANDHDDLVVLDAERVLSGKERLAIVEATVRAMEPRRRQVLLWHTMHGLNLSEISRRIGLSHTRVSQLFASAVAECERALRDADGKEG